MDEKIKYLNEFEEIDIKLIDKFKFNVITNPK